MKACVLIMPLLGKCAHTVEQRFPRQCLRVGVLICVVANSGCATGWEKTVHRRWTAGVLKDFIDISTIMQQNKPKA